MKNGYLFVAVLIFVLAVITFNKNSEVVVVDTTKQTIGETTTQGNESNVKIEVLDYRVEGPGYVEVGYENVDLGEGGFSLCPVAGEIECPMWLETFDFNDTSGTYRMDVRNGNPEETKELGPRGEYSLSLVGEDPSNIITSIKFTVE